MDAMNSSYGSTAYYGTPAAAAAAAAALTAATTGSARSHRVVGGIGSTNASMRGQNPVIRNCSAMDRKKEGEEKVRSDDINNCRQLSHNDCITVDASKTWNQEKTTTAAASASLSSSSKLESERVLRSEVSSNHSTSRTSSQFKTRDNRNEERKTKSRSPCPSTASLVPDNDRDILVQKIASESNTCGMKICDNILKSDFEFERNPHILLDLSNFAIGIPSVSASTGLINQPGSESVRRPKKQEHHYSFPASSTQSQCHQQLSNKSSTGSTVRFEDEVISGSVRIECEVKEEEENEEKDFIVSSSSSLYSSHSSSFPDKITDLVSSSHVASGSESIKQAEQRNSCRGDDMTSRYGHTRESFCDLL
jgi:hypothetical protein